MLLRRKEQTNCDFVLYTLRSRSSTRDVPLDEHEMYSWMVHNSNLSRWVFARTG